VDEYNEHLSLLEEAEFKPVYEYFMSSWDCIKEEWVVGLKQSCHFNNHTNNRLESINQKFKRRSSTLPQFFEGLDVVLSSLRQERDACLTSAIMKRPTISSEIACLTSAIMKRPTISSEIGSPQYKYVQFLTPFAFQFVMEQIELSEKIIFSEEVHCHYLYFLWSN